ncbi:peptidase S16, lon-like protein [Candidatus Magnetoovum chiemensis]|nr:peptidase S16, lon-like protein [Candidatus Magnetoovum chiemensis]
MIEGDSATCAELYALISSIALIPLKQSIAVTGSMDQSGKVQPVGGINQKIEGFFDLCKLRGLNGKQGIIMPKLNVKNLMLKKDVIIETEKENFNIYAIEHIDEGLEILTGMKAGELNENDSYPENTLNCLVEKRLTEIKEAMKEDSKPNNNNNNNNNITKQRQNE